MSQTISPGDTVAWSQWLAANDSRPPMVKPLDIPCRYCKAEPGENCTRWRKRSRRRGKYKAPRTPHPDRVYDARCASDAASTLSGDETSLWVVER